jgi:uncharacterized protein YfaS (alpha-2-macroglobulin family)
MNRLREFQYLSEAASWRLAAAYKLVGQPEIGLKMIANLPITIKPYVDYGYTFGSDLRDEAMILETLTLLGQKNRISEAFHDVANKLSQDDWYSTQTTAYSLLAIAEYCGANHSANKLQFTYNSGNITSRSYLWQSDLSVNGGKVSLNNKGSNRLYVRVIQRGQPATGQDVEPVNNPDILEMRVGYFTLTGKQIDPTKLKQGTDFVAQVNVKNPGNKGYYRNMALSQIFPSGWEIINMRLADTTEAFNSSPSDYRDIRDDRVNTHFSVQEGKEVTYYVMLNAAYLGRFYMPAISCEAMYNHTINAVQKGQWVEVVK